MSGMTLLGRLMGVEWEGEFLGGRGSGFVSTVLHTKDLLDIIDNDVVVLVHNLYSRFFWV